MELYKISSEVKSQVISYFNVNDKDVQNFILVAQNWAMNQTLPAEALDEKFIEIMLLRNKFDIERTKRKIKSFFEHIHDHTEIFCRLGQLKPSEETGVIIHVPVLTQDFERIVIFEFEKDKVHEFDVERSLILGVSIALLMYVNDYHTSIRFVLNFEGLTLKNFVKITPKLLGKLHNIYENIITVRLKGVEIVNAPAYFSVIMRLCRKFLRPKLFNRITVHKNWASVYKVIPKELFPRDFGGEQESCKEILKVWDKLFEEQQDFFKKMSDLATSSQNQ